jgi:hypothetical protein
MESTTIGIFIESCRMSWLGSSVIHGSARQKCPRQRPGLQISTDRDRGRLVHIHGGNHVPVLRQRRCLPGSSLAHSPEVDTALKASLPLTTMSLERSTD